MEREHDMASGSMSRQHKKKLEKRAVIMRALRLKNKALKEEKEELTARFQSLSARYDELEASHEVSEGKVSVNNSVDFYFATGVGFCHLL